MSLDKTIKNSIPEIKLIDLNIKKIFIRKPGTIQFQISN